MAAVYRVYREKKDPPVAKLWVFYGEQGIRTLGRDEPSRLFESRTLNHSDNSPCPVFRNGLFYIIPSGDSCVNLFLSDFHHIWAGSLQKFSLFFSGASRPSFPSLAAEHLKSVFRLHHLKHKGAVPSPFLPVMICLHTALMNNLFRFHSRLNCFLKI